jgi:ApbE superfamily uncharacterized protein (UPF0280 family)
MNAPGPLRARLPGGRWHLQHGPIDLVIGADAETGGEAACARAHEDCWQRFQGVLGELVAELPQLRTDCRLPGAQAALAGRVARRMAVACRPYAIVHDLFVTPMAAVAGSVADELIDCYRRPGVRRAYVNNGGDIALHLAAGAQFRIGVVGDVDAPAIDAAMTVDAQDRWRGVATSGRGGRSLSLGIADSVTVLARDAASADAAATLVANHVDVEHPAIRRKPACEVRDDSDLGTLPVTIAVPTLPREAVALALARGETFARTLRAQGLIEAAVLHLQGAWRLVSSTRPLPAGLPVGA